jgi:hypothetical protein
MQAGAATSPRCCRRECVTAIFVVQMFNDWYAVKMVIIHFVSIQQTVGEFRNVWQARPQMFVTGVRTSFRSIKYRVRINFQLQTFQLQHMEN